MLGVDPTIDINGLMLNGYGLITCGVSDMPSTGSVSIFYREQIAKYLTADNSVFPYSNANDMRGTQDLNSFS